MDFKLVNENRLDLISYMEDVLDELETLAEMVGANSDIMLALTTVREQIKIMQEEENA